MIESDASSEWKPSDDSGSEASEGEEDVEESSAGVVPDSQPGSADAVPDLTAMAAAKKRHEKGRGTASRAKKRLKSAAGSASGLAGANKSGRASRPSRSCTLRPAAVSQGEERCASMSSSEDEDSGVESDASSEWKPSDDSGSEASEGEEDVEESSEYDSTQSSEDEEDVEEILD